jgi:putative component of membrane protein insertase Oxa1/YidC/SpoIIIJ protein YidD
MDGVESAGPDGVKSSAGMLEVRIDSVKSMVQSRLSPSTPPRCPPTCADYDLKRLRPTDLGGGIPWRAVDAAGACAGNQP